MRCLLSAVLVVLVTSPLSLAAADDSTSSADKPIALISDGVPQLVRYDEAVWKQQGGWFVGHGERQYVRASIGIGEGSFRMTARLRMLEQKQCAAGIQFGTGFFGFEGRREEIFVNGSMFDGYKNLGPSQDAFERGAWIDFVVERRDDDVIRFLINGRQAAEAAFPGKIDRIGLTPWRSTMQIQDWSLTAANTFEIPAPKTPGYSIPLIDLAADKSRQTIVDREAGQYLGHPTTVLLEDNKTMLCVYPQGHGKGPIVMKRSDDAGLTWSERLPVPENWATSQETPTIHRVVDAKGTKRLILFSGLYPIRMSVSEDDGVNWTPLKPIGKFGGIVTMSCVERLHDGRYMALFHDDGRFFRGSGKASKFFVYKTLSGDGGLTWSEPAVIATHDIGHLCEPGLVRSPDGKQIAVLLRENSRRLNSFVIFSDDEGETWTDPVELPGSLTGDRHTGKYGPDGRLFISFRDRTHVSSTKGDWVGWVGTYDDLVSGREGQYRVRLMDNHRGSDCAYPAVDILPDGTFVTTTYGHWTKDEPPYIVSVRFTLDELDRLSNR